jgi:hypothetical protein
MKVMKMVFCFAPLLLVTACADFATFGFDKSNTVGRDVDEVIVKIEESGLRCTKYKDKEVFTNKSIGAVKCSIKEHLPICPDSYNIYLGYDLDTGKVSSIGKDKRTNCF